MNKHQIKRLVGYALWIIGLTVLMPPVFLTGSGLVTLSQFLLFNGLLVCLLGGYLLVDSANSVLKRKYHAFGAAKPIGASAADVRDLIAEKHYHPAAPVPDALEDHQPDDMPAARSLFVIVAVLLAVFVVIVAIMWGSNQGGSSGPATTSEAVRTEQGR